MHFSLSTTTGTLVREFAKGITFPLQALAACFTLKLW
jgi:hypothetical protein